MELIIIECAILRNFKSEQLNIIINTERVFDINELIESAYFTC